MSLEDLLSQGLPMNRKERFFTGTVFPGIVCADSFAYFDRLLDLLPGSPRATVDATPATANIQFFTEYSLAESVYGSSTTRLPQPPVSKDTPDILMLIAASTPLLVALEAKMYDPVTREALEAQMLRQRTVVLDYLEAALPIPSNRVIHAALLPKPLADQMRGLAYPFVTWEDLYEKFTHRRSEDYFLATLRIALARYPDLVGPGAEYGGNREARCRGSEIYTRYKLGRLEYELMGRSQGLGGEPLLEDLRSGRWTRQVYEMRQREPVPNPNWFRVDDFIALADKLGEDVAVPK